MFQKYSLIGLLGFSLLFSAFFFSGNLFAASVKNVGVASKHLNPVLLRSDGSVFYAAPDAHNGRRVITELGYDNQKIISDGNTVFVLKNNGDVWSAGANLEGSLGRPGVSSSSDLKNWGKISGISWIEKISVSFGRSYAIDSSGNLWTWGFWVDFWTGGSIGSLDSPVNISEAVVDFPSDVVDISVSSGNKIMLTSGGSIYTWGATSEPSLVSGFPMSGVTIERVFCNSSNSFFAISSTVTMYSWGLNVYGETLTGVAALTPVSEPTQSNLPSGVVFGSIFTNGNSSMYGLTAAGEVYAWGRNTSDGILGVGYASPDLDPVLVPEMIIDGIVAYSSELNPIFVLTESGDLYYWGVASSPEENEPQIFTGSYDLDGEYGNEDNSLVGDLPKSGIATLFYSLIGFVLVGSVLVLGRMRS